MTKRNQKAAKQCGRKKEFHRGWNGGGLEFKAMTQAQASAPLKLIRRLNRYMTNQDAKPAILSVSHLQPAE